MTLNYLQLYTNTLVGEVELGRMPTDIPALTVGWFYKSYQLSKLEILFCRDGNDNYLDTVTDKYRITGMSWSITNDMAETMSLTPKRASIPRKKPIYIRYKDIINGSSVNSGNHCGLQIQAIEMQDKERR